jgi:hypothetical protein
VANGFGLTFIDLKNRIEDWDLAGDGLDVNRRGKTWFWKL